MFRKTYRASILAFCPSTNLRFIDNNVFVLNSCETFKTRDNIKRHFLQLNWHNTTDEALGPPTGDQQLLRRRLRISYRRQTNGPHVSTKFHGFVDFDQRYIGIVVIHYIEPRVHYYLAGFDALAFVALIGSDSYEHLFCAVVSGSKFFISKIVFMGWGWKIKKCEPCSLLPKYKNKFWLF